MRLGLCSSVFKFLLWASVCMESCMPLMAVRYLQLRSNLYTAVCQCYYAFAQPLQAELFARRGLDKVHKLAQMEHQSSTEPCASSTLIFKEATVKLGVLVFKRSVFESHKANKASFRLRVRPDLRDLLQLPSPRYV